MTYPTPSKKHVLNGLGLLILLVLVFPFVASTYPPIVGATESYVVQSGSMEPVLQPGSVIFVYEAQPSTIEEGDIITYNLQGAQTRVTTHRVVDVISDDQLQFQTKGDANEEPDQYVVPPSAVIGTVPTLIEDTTIPGIGYVEEVPATIPFMGRILLFAGSRWGILTFVIVPAALLIINEVYDLAMAYRRATNESGGESQE